ncbi:plasmid mobilization protein [Streptomyces cavernicola]|uniref:Mobilization protein n=1 Tax=Streptomyces cavernicola TaxID=3043613 RepID=A0ABT6S463_9ACTN|nr:mobilization protein [Streptomyces sp. B-S-A6]MDI3402853.1 mobilization protein [Streptomyces sp. B-S-A6]
MAEPVRRQGAPDGDAATEGGSQLSTAGRKHRARGKARARDKQQRPAVSVRLNDHERDLIQAGADEVGMSLAGFLAHSALGAARDRSRTAVVIASERDVLTELFGARRQLGWAGSNLNQAAKALNSGGDVPHLQEVFADVQRTAIAVQKAADRVANPDEGRSS